MILRWKNHSCWMSRKNFDGGVRFNFSTPGPTITSLTLTLSYYTPFIPYFYSIISILYSLYSITSYPIFFVIFIFIIILPLTLTHSIYYKTTSSSTSSLTFYFTSYSFFYSISFSSPSTFLYSLLLYSHIPHYHLHLL